MFFEQQQEFLAQNRLAHSGFVKQNFLGSKSVLGYFIKQPGATTTGEKEFKTNISENI